MLLCLTEEELDETAKEIAERVKDLVYMNLEHRVRDALEKTFASCVDLDPNDKLTLTWKLTFTVNDIIQIAGRLRRTKRKK